jgi:hypothetical protein
MIRSTDLSPSMRQRIAAIDASRAVRTIAAFPPPGVSLGTKNSPEATSVRPVRKADNCRMKARIGFRSQLEADWAGQLELRRLAGEIASWQYEPRTFVLGSHRSYTPDFRVIYPGGARIDWHEVKGPQFWDKDRVRVDWFVAAYPDLPLYIVTRDKKKGWSTKRRMP